MVNDGKILVVTDFENIHSQIKPLLKDYSNTNFTRSSEVKVEIDRIAPDVIIIYQESQDTNVDLIQYINSEVVDASIIFTTDNEDFELLRDATRAGAEEFFVLPNELNILEERLSRIVRLSMKRKVDDANTSQSFKRGRGQVYSFYSGKGGGGRSFLASSFAQTLKIESTAQVVLIDLNLQYGGVETFLGMESNRSFVELMPVIDELNESHIRNVVEKEKYSGLELLLSPRDAESAENITETFVSKLIRACRRSYDFVIIDLPSTVTEVTYIALEESDLIYYVMNLDSLSLQVFKHVETLFQRLNIDKTNRLELVINKTTRDNEVKSSDVKNFITDPVATEIRLDYKGVQALLNQGEPIRKEQSEKKLVPVAKDIRKWVLSNI